MTDEAELVLCHLSRDEQPRSDLSLGEGPAG